MKKVLLVTKVYVNGVNYYRGKDFDDIRVVHPTDKHPFWVIDLFVDGELVTRIWATGNVIITERKE